MDFQALLSFMSDAHLQDDDDVDEELFHLLAEMEGPEELLYHVRFIKDEGNCLFKNGLFREAFGVYDKAAKLLTFSLPMCSGNKEPFRDLAFSLNLNLSACALKLHEYSRARNLCSLVLEFDPRNTKALYRRGIASMELGLFLESYDDLMKAVEMEPRNQDICHALERVRELIQPSNKGKRKLDKYTVLGGDFEGKRIMSFERGESSKSYESCLTKSCCDEVSSTYLDKKGLPENFQQGAKDVDMVDSISIRSTITDSNDPKWQNATDRFKTNVVEPRFRFLNRRRQGSFLHISSTAYKKLIDGQEIQFFHPRHFSVMRVAICKTPEVISKELPNAPNPKEGVIPPTSPHSSVNSNVMDEPQDDLTSDAPKKVDGDVPSLDTCSSRKFPPRQSVFWFTSQSKPGARGFYARYAKLPPNHSTMLSGRSTTSRGVVSTNHFLACRFQVGSKRKAISTFMKNKSSVSITQVGVKRKDGPSLGYEFDPSRDFVKFKKKCFLNYIADEHPMASGRVLNSLSGLYNNIDSSQVSFRGTMSCT